MPAGASGNEAAGQVLLLPLVEPHVHLDRTLWGEPWRPMTVGLQLVAFPRKRSALRARRGGAEGAGLEARRRDRRLLDSRVPQRVTG
jgi:cytosine/adenosine deaminase-related metal-dependent hydrolase